MSTSNTRFLKASLFALLGGATAACSGDSGAECGDGTVELDGVCVPESSLACGDGTLEVDGECVPDPGAPGSFSVTTVSSPTPYAGGGILVIQGTGFDSVDSGALTVTIDGVAQEEVAVVSDTRAVTTLPVATGFTADIVVANDLGTATVPFTYEGLLGSEGRLNAAGALNLVDPRNGFSVRVAPLTRDPGGGAPLVTYGVSGLAFGADGTLYGTEVASSVDDGPQLLEIDPATGTVTEIGTLVDAGATTHPNMPDLAFDGTTMYAWTENGDDLATIDLATGAVTLIVSDLNSAGSGLEFFGGQLLGTQDGLATIGTDGAIIATVPLMGNNDNIAALTVYKGELWGATAGGGSLVVKIDPATGMITPIGGTGLGGLDALVALPDNVMAREHTFDPALLDGVDLARFAPPALPRPAAVEAAAPSLVASEVLPGDAQLDARGRATAALGEVTQGRGVRVVSADGELTLTAAQLDGYRLTANQRGALKLVDADGKTVARRISALELR
jgi:hypothetical protein